MNKKILNEKKVSETFLQNSCLTQAYNSKLTGFARSSVGFTLRQYKEIRSIEKKTGRGKKDSYKQH